MNSLERVGVAASFTKMLRETLGWNCSHECHLCLPYTCGAARRSRKKLQNRICRSRSEGSALFVVVLDASCPLTIFPYSLAAPTDSIVLFIKHENENYKEC